MGEPDAARANAPKKNAHCGARTASLVRAILAST